MFVVSMRMCSGCWQGDLSELVRDSRMRTSIAWNGADGLGWQDTRWNRVAHTNTTV